MAFSSVLSILLSTHSVDCAVPLLLSIHVLIVPFSSVHRTNCAILTVRSPHFLSIYCDFSEFNVANNETQSKRNLTFFEMENCFFLRQGTPPRAFFVKSLYFYNYSKSTLYKDLKTPKKYIYIL